MATATLTISFTPPATPPANGYLVQYGIPGEAVQTVSPNPASSPVVITGLTPGSVYQGTVQGDCGGGDLSSVQNFSANPPIDPTAYGVLVVDIYNGNSTTNVAGVINTPGVTETDLLAYTGSNFSPMSSSASPDTCDILAGDYNGCSALTHRFEFNIKKHILEYPDITSFVYQIIGRDTSAYTLTGQYNLKGANDSTLRMVGGPGSYCPSVLNGTIPFTPVAYSVPIGTGADGTYSTALPVLATFTYDVASKTITQS